MPDRFEDSATAYGAVRVKLDEKTQELASSEGGQYLIHHFG